MSDELDNKEDATVTEVGTESAIEDTIKIAKESEVAVDTPTVNKQVKVAEDTPTIAKEEAAPDQPVEPANAQSEKESPDSTANTESTKDQDKDQIEEVKEPTKSSVTSSTETVVPDAPTEDEKQSDNPVPQSISDDTNAKSVEPVERPQANKSGEDTPKSSNPTTQDAASVGPEIDEHSEHLTYKDDGTVIFTDPKTHYQYKWCSETDKWVAQDVTLENEFYKWCPEANQWLPKETATETEHYKWDAEKCEWVVKEVVAAAPTATVDEEGRRIYTDKDGAVFFWDTEKKAWFPKIDDDFMARYQMNYGFIDNTSAGEAEQRLKAEIEEKRKAEELQRMTAEAKQADDDDEKKDAGEATAAPNGGKRKAKPEPPKWFDLNPEQNTKVYVSNLPLDITLDEFAELMSKCGMIMRDPKTQKYKLKLYSEPDGQLKGDGLCDYIKVESVGLAIKILDEYNYRGHKIHVQRAQFQMRGEYNPALKPKRKKSDKEKLQKIKEKLFDWRPEKMRGERSKNEKIVIIKNLFSPELFEKEVQLILDYQNDLRDECSKCGTVRKVVIYDRHPEGVAQVNMSSPEDADIVIQMMNGRFFGKRKLIADHWDGKTKYKIAESETEAQKRLAEWDKFLIEEEAKFEQIERSGQRVVPQPIAEQERAEEAALTAQLESEMHAEDDD